MDKREIIVELQPYIDHPPVDARTAHSQACSNDGVTIDRWFDTWVSNIRENNRKFGSFAEHSLGKIWNLLGNSPCIVAGSGPSLKKTVEILKDRPKGMRLVSCLHNFHYMEDHDAQVDFYVSLDAGPVTVEEVSEGGSRSEEEYWELTKNRILICYIGTSPELLKKWRGKVYFFNAPVPHDGFREKVSEIEPFNLWVESGGNVLGASMMVTKGFLGSQTIIFIGADFSFSNEEKRTFHAWDSKYDKDIGRCMRAVDIYGNTVLTWQSYHNFKLWFDVVSQRVPGIYINSSSAGIMGSYREGNIRQIVQMPLEKAYEMFSVHEIKRDQCMNPENDDRKVFI
jgi:hypothetical protein